MIKMSLLIGIINFLISITYYQQHLRNLPFPVSSVDDANGSILKSSATFIPTVCYEISPFYNNFNTFYANTLNAPSTFL